MTDREKLTLRLILSGILIWLAVWRQNPWAMTLLLVLVTMGIEILVMRQQGRK